MKPLSSALTRLDEIIVSSTLLHSTDRFSSAGRCPTSPPGCRLVEGKTTGLKLQCRLQAHAVYGPLAGLGGGCRTEGGPVVDGGDALIKLQHRQLCEL